MTHDAQPESEIRSDAADAHARAFEISARYAGWRVAAASALGVFCASLVIVSFPVLFRSFAHEFGWSREAVSRAFALAAGTGAVCAVPLGILVNRVPVRRIVVPSAIVFGLGFASLAMLGPRLEHLYGVFALLGAAAMGTSPVAYGRTVSGWFRARRGLALAMLVAGGALGGVLHPPAMEHAIGAFGWRGACVALGAFVVLVGVPIVALLVREAPVSDATEADSWSKPRFGAALRSRAFVLLALGILGGTLVQNAVIVHLFALLTDRGFDGAEAARALSLMAAAAVVGRLVSGYCVDRVSPKLVAVVTLLLAAWGAYLLASADTLTAASLAAMLVGFGTGGEADVVPYMLSKYFGLRALSTLYGIAWMAGAIGGAAGPVLLGRAFDRDGTYEHVLPRLACVAIVAALVMLALPRVPSGTDARVPA